MLEYEFLRVARRRWHHTAIVDKATGKELTYGRVLIAGFILASRFKHLSGGFLGVLLPTSAACTITVLGGLIARKTLVMINYSTGALENTAYARQKCEFEHIITSRKFLEKLGISPVPGMIFMEDILKAVTPISKIKAFAKARIFGISSQRRSEENIAVILFTTGSEKEPKAVPLSHRNLLFDVRSCGKALKYNENDCLLALLPFFHSFGITTGLWLPLLQGMKTVMMPNPLEYKTIGQAAREHGATIMLATPAFYMGFVQKCDSGDFGSMRLIIAGADKVSDHIRHAFEHKFGKDILEGYGATETSPVISVNPPENNRHGSMGIPLPGVQVRIVDIDTGMDLPSGCEGKIMVKGDNVMSGYFMDTEETAKVLHQGWYDTGDMGVQDKDGYLWHRGRLKRFVKIAGEMISLVRIESELEKLLPENVLCCVVDKPDAVRGARLVAVITHPVDEHHLIRELGRVLPAIAVPKKFVVMEEMPMMGSGKVNFRKLTTLV